MIIFGLQFEYIKTMKDLAWWEVEYGISKQLHILDYSNLKPSTQIPINFTRYGLWLLPFFFPFPFLFVNWDGPSEPFKASDSLYA